MVTMDNKAMFLVAVVVTLVLNLYVIDQVDLNYKGDFPKSRHRRHSVVQLRQLWSLVSQQDIFQVVDRNFTTTYVYSAYFDDRPAPDVTGWNDASTHVVRVFAWFRRFENSPLDSYRGWRCVFWNNELEMIEEVPVESFTDTDWHDPHSELVRAMLLCPFTVIHDCTDAGNMSSASCSRRASPQAVSIVISPWINPINLIKVIDLNTRRNQASSPIDKHNNSSKAYVQFAVCMKPFYGGSITVYNIVEFIEVNMVFGAQLFHFYVDDKLDKKLLRVLEHYERLGVVEKTVWNLPPDAHPGAPYKGQMLAMTECQYRLMYRTKYLVITDMDEFIVPARTEDWSSMLALIQKESKYGNGDRIASYSFRNRFFSLELPNFNPSSLIGSAYSIPSPNWTRKFPTLTRITGRVRLYQWSDRSKIIAPPERVLTWLTHDIVRKHVVPPGEYNLGVDEKDAVMHHYRFELDQPNMNYTRMWHFKHKIIPQLKKGFDLVQSLN